MSRLNPETVAFYDNPSKHYFYQIQKLDDGWYRRTVTPLINPRGDRGYYRVGTWKPFVDGMAEQFREDFPEREPPADWDDAILEDR